MSAISNQGFGTGFMQGFEFVDSNIRQRNHDQQAIEDRQFQRDQAAQQNARLDRSEEREGEAIKTADARYAEERDYRERRDKKNDQRDDSADKRDDRTLAIAEKTARTKQILDAYDLSSKQRAALKDRAIQEGAIAMNGGQPFSIELHEQLVKAGMPAFSPYSYLDQNFVGQQEKLGGILDAVKSGNLELVNSPESLDAINHVYAEQIRKGVGEFNSDQGGNVVAKRITKLQAGPGGSVVAHVNVHLDNGKSYDAPMTVARSADPHDPVKKHDAGVMIDDVMGRYRMAQLAKSPEYQNGVRSMYALATRDATASKVPAGYRKTADGNLEAIPGGPGDKRAAAKPLPVGLQKIEDSDIEGIQLANSMHADLGAIKQQVDDGSLQLGLWSNMTGTARNYLGQSDENSRNLATFKSTLEKMRNDSLRLNKGVQTEGDAQRAWNEVFQNINDPEVVSKRLEEIQSINERAADQRMQRVNLRRENNGAPRIEDWDRFSAAPVINDAAKKTDAETPPSPTTLAPQSDQPQQAQPSAKYSIGQIIEHGGQQYRITGGDLNNDPEVEPVQ